VVIKEVLTGMTRGQDSLGILAKELSSDSQTKILDEASSLFGKQIAKFDDFGKIQDIVTHE
jgi:uncharacterized phage infection (PIP) family protein YhgE